MHLAVLMTNTDESDFAQRHPKDGEKFTHLIHLVRPKWQVTSYPVKDDVFPDDMTLFDGVIITGSPASVHDRDPWVTRLQRLIKTIYVEGTPIFGACYGHQAIALALGGSVGPNPSGWVFGRTVSNVITRAPWMTDLPDTFTEYGAHIEAVTQLPDGAQPLTVSDTCPVTGYRIANAVYTTQNHPEMTPAFVDALIDEYERKLPEGVGATARASLIHDVDQRTYAETIARFFELRSAN